MTTSLSHKFGNALQVFSVAHMGLSFMNAATGTDLFAEAMGNIAGKDLPGQDWAGNPLGLLAVEGVLNGLGYWAGGQMKKLAKNDAPAPKAG